jgi:hypothetical protein
MSRREGCSLRSMTEQSMQRGGSTASGRESIGDTVRIPALAEQQLKFLSELAEAGVDPYETDRQREIVRGRSPRRTLDDMRRLSEAIKRARGSATEPVGNL